MKMETRWIDINDCSMAVLCWLMHNTMPFFLRWFFGWRGCFQNGKDKYCFTRKQWKWIDEAAQLLKEGW